MLTHAHIDHSGLLPRLVANGFHGPIFCTAGTADLCSLVLPDAGRLQEEDARLANRQRFSRHAPALPLFTEADAYEALSHFETVEFDRRVDGRARHPGRVHQRRASARLRVRPCLAPEWRRSARFCSAATSAATAGRSCPTRRPRPDADTLLLESTYGDRVHPDADDATRLERIVNETTARGGRVIIPAFAVGRAEEVLYWLKRLEDTGRLKPLPVYLDSPMAVDALNFYARHERELDPDVRAGTGEVGAYATRRFQPVASPRESREIIGLTRSCHRHFRQRDGDRRSRAASLAARAARPAQHRSVCRFSGRRERVAARSSMARKASRFTG